MTTKLNIPYYRKVMKVPLTYLKNEYENMHGVRNADIPPIEKFSAVIETTNANSDM